jgi:hypothetical protein
MAIPHGHAGEGCPWERAGCMVIAVLALAGLSKKEIAKKLEVGEDSCVSSSGEKFGSGEGRRDSRDGDSGVVW